MSAKIEHGLLLDQILVDSQSCGSHILGLAGFAFPPPWKSSRVRQIFGRWLADMTRRRVQVVRRRVIWRRKRRFPIKFMKKYCVDATLARRRANWTRRPYLRPQYAYCSTQHAYWGSEVRASGPVGASAVSTVMMACVARPWDYSVLLY